jgi:hypothetical protein
MVLNQQRLRLQLAKAAALRTLAAPNTGMSSPFCLRSGSDPTTSVLYRLTAHPVHVNQLSFSVGGSNHVQWVSGVGVLLWSQHT